MQQTKPRFGRLLAPPAWKRSKGKGWTSSGSSWHSIVKLATHKHTLRPTLRTESTQLGFHFWRPTLTANNVGSRNIGLHCQPSNMSFCGLSIKAVGAYIGCQGWPQYRGLNKVPILYTTLCPCHGVVTCKITGTGRLSKIQNP